MSLKKTIEGDIKKAMLAKDKDRLRALRAIKSQILLAETEKGNEGELSEDKANALLMKAAKQRKDSAEVYKQQGREDLLENELIELKVIEEYLPKQMEEGEVRKVIITLIEKSGASSPSEMGKVIGMAMKELNGQADGKLISQIVKEELSK